MLAVRVIDVFMRLCPSIQQKLLVRLATKLQVREVESRTISVLQSCYV